jgi:hypothetical protein
MGFFRAACAFPRARLPIQEKQMQIRRLGWLRFPARREKGTLGGPLPRSRVEEIFFDFA